MAAARHPADSAPERAKRDELAFWDEWLQETRLGLESLVERTHALHSHGAAHPRLGDSARGTRRPPPFPSLSFLLASRHAPT